MEFGEGGGGSIWMTTLSEILPCWKSVEWVLLSFVSDVERCGLVMQEGDTL